MVMGKLLKAKSQYDLCKASENPHNKILLRMCKWPDSHRIEYWFQSHSVADSME